MVKKSSSLIEIYHFINPMGKVCYQAEKAITEFAGERSEKISLRFIPYLSFKSISEEFYKENKRLMDLDERNNLYVRAYQASLAFYAASMQGKKFGRAFLLLLQKCVLDDNIEVTNELFVDIARELKLDIDMFLEDRTSDCAINMYNTDQQLVHEMAVQSTPTCIIYTNQNADSGYLLERVSHKNELHQLFEPKYSETSNIVSLNQFL